MPEFRLLKKFGSSPGTLLDFGQINGVARGRVFGLRGFGTSLFRNAGTVLEEDSPHLFQELRHFRYFVGLDGLKGFQIVSRVTHGVS